MISVIIPTLNSEQSLGPTLAALVPAVVDGLVKEVIIADGGSQDETARIAEVAGARFLSCPQGRGQQLAAGAQAARAPWLLFLHSDTCLATDWHREAAQFMEQVSQSGRPRAAAFRFRLDDFGFRPRFLEAMVQLRCLIFALPYGDQGLLIPKSLYETLGGFRPLPLMEDVDFVRRLGRRRLSLLRTAAVTDARRFREEGYFRRSARNLTCLLLYALHVPPHRLVRLYG